MRSSQDRDVNKRTLLTHPRRGRNCTLYLFYITQILTSVHSLHTHPHWRVCALRLISYQTHIIWPGTTTYNQIVWQRNQDPVQKLAKILFQYHNLQTKWFRTIISMHFGRYRWLCTYRKMMQRGFIQRGRDQKEWKRKEKLLSTVRWSRVAGRQTGPDKCQACQSKKKPKISWRG